MPNSNFKRKKFISAFKYLHKKLYNYKFEDDNHINILKKIQ